MNIYQKLMLIAIGPAALTWGVSLHASQKSRSPLFAVSERTSTERISIAQSRGIMHDVYDVVHTRFKQWQSYTQYQLVPSTLVDADGFVGLPTLEWKLAIEFLSHDNFVSAVQSRSRVLFTTVVAVILLAILGAIVALSLTDGVREPMSATKAIREGKLHSALPVVGHDQLTQWQHMKNKCVELNRKLIESSRQAGTDNVATGALYNVRNVLNSVNVLSANILMEGLTNSRVGRLRKAVLFLNAQGDEIGNFVVSDDRGRHFSRLLDELSRDLTMERDRKISKLRRLVDNLHHIRQIIFAQQTLASSRGQTESVELCQVIEDAINIAQAGLPRHNIDIVRDYKPTPPAPTGLPDNTMALQILIDQPDRQRPSVRLCTQRSEEPP